MLLGAIPFEHGLVHIEACFLALDVEVAIGSVVAEAAAAEEVEVVVVVVVVAAKGGRQWCKEQEE